VGDGEREDKVDEWRVLSGVSAVDGVKGGLVLSQVLEVFLQINNAFFDFFDVVGDTQVHYRVIVILMHVH
jgi:hypothetical protein